MSYIWDILLKCDKQNISRETLVFEIAQVYSAYMEVAFVDLNTTTIIEKKVEVNPYYRFYHIFKGLFNINYETEVELRRVLFDLVMHKLGSVDLKAGLCKSEYYKKFILRDIEEKMYGEVAAEQIQVLAIEKRDMICDGLITLYETGSSIHLFKKMVSKLFVQSIIYRNQDNKKEILIYLKSKETLESKRLMEIILFAFLPIDYNVVLYWEYHFGVIGVEDTMVLGEMVLY